MHQNHLGVHSMSKGSCPTICPELLSNCRFAQQQSLPPSGLDVPIALQKAKRSYTNHPLYNFLSYDGLTLSFHQLALPLSFISILRSYEEALLVLARKQAMDEEIDALVSRGT